MKIISLDTTDVTNDASVVKTRFEERLQQLEEQAGQSLIILAFSFIGLVAMLGMALDLGMVYVERVRMKRTVDAAILAGVVELPVEEQAFDRAIEYIEANGYSTGIDTEVYVKGCVETSPGTWTDTSENSNPFYLYLAATDPVTKATFYIDAGSFRDVGAVSCNVAGNMYGASSKLAITGTSKVQMNFMRVLNFTEVDVLDSGVAQNVSNLDVVVVFDKSGSMEFDTVCYGCWDREDATDPDYPNNGEFFPLRYADTLNSDICDNTVDSHDNSGYKYVFIEAEYYSINRSSWEFREPGKSYWALQRTSYNEKSSTKSSSLDDRSAHVTHHPFVTWSNDVNLFGMYYSLADAQSNVAPRLDYQFRTDWTGTAYIWVRAQGGGYYSENLSQNRDDDELYWAVDSGTPQGFTSSNPIYESCQNYDLACSDRWRWIRIVSMPVTAGMDYTLKFWAGSSGVDIDKIAITNDPRPSGSLITYSWTSINALKSDSNRGLEATPGSARMQACDPCNPIYGLTVTKYDCNPSSAECPGCSGMGYFQVYTDTEVNLLDNDLWGDEEPMRTSQEAIKTFAERLDPKFDQIGFVPFNDSVSPGNEAPLSCLRMASFGCYEHDDGLSYTTPLSYSNVLSIIENNRAGGSTDIAEGLRNGLEALGVDPDNLDPELASSRTTWDNECDYAPPKWNQGYATRGNSACGRGGAATRVLILLTDGVPTASFGGECGDNLNLYPYKLDSQYACVIYYAQKARDNGVVLYTIGLGNGVDERLLALAAETARGQSYIAANPKALDGIFSQILSNIYVRIIR